MNIMNRVTWQMMRKNRVRTIVTIIGIILSTAMFAAVFTICWSLYNYVHDVEVDASGSYHVHALHAPGAEALKAEADNRTEYAAYAESLGYAPVDSANPDKPYICVYAVDDTFIANMPVKLIDGRLPQNENEIVLPAHIISNGGAQYAVGDTMTLDLGERLAAWGDEAPLYQDSAYQYDDERLSNINTFNYTVVGICERPDFEPFRAPGYTALTLHTGAVEADRVYECWLRIKDPGAELADYIEEHSGLFEVYEEHSSLLSLEGVTGYDNIKKVLTGFAVILAVIIFVGSVSLIYSAFSISVSERTKQFGLLSSVGATKKQTRRSVLFEAISLSAIGIPVGIFAGVGGIALTLRLLRDKFASLIAGSELPIHVYVSWQSILAAAAIALVTVLVSAWIPAIRAMRVSPMEAIRQTRDLKAKNRGSRYPKLAVKLFGAEGLLAEKYYTRSRKKYRATIISLVVSIVLFISASAFCMYITDSANETDNRPDYDGLCIISRADYERLRPALLECVDSLSAFTCEELYTAYIPEEDSTAEYRDYLSRIGQADDLYYTQQAGEYYLDDTAFRELLKANGIPEEGFFDPDNPRALVVNHDSYVSYARQQDGSISRVTYAFDYFNKSAKAISLAPWPEAPAGYEPAGAYWSGAKRGEGELTLYFVPSSVHEGKEPAFDEFGRPLGQPAIPLEFTQRPIGALIAEDPVGEQGGAMIEVIYPLSTFKDEVGSMTMVFRSSDSSASIERMTDIMRQAGLTVNSDTFYDVNEEYRTMGNIVTIVKVFSYGFITLISLIAVANVFNTVSTNVALRRRDYAMLRSMGMTQKGITRMSNYECLIYGSRSLLIGLPIAAALTWVIHRVANDATVMRFKLPWTAIVVAIVSVFLVVFLSMLYSTRKLKKDNPIDALKDENI